MKKKLSKKAQDLIYKMGGSYQSGGFTPYIDDSIGNLIDPTMLAPNLQAAQNQNVQALNNFTPGQIQLNPNQLQTQQGQQGQKDLTDTLLSGFGPLAKVGTGIISLVNAQKDKKRQRLYDQLSKQDLENRIKDQDINGFYDTPYSTRKNFTMQQGGSIGQTPYNDMSLDYFENYYQNMEDQNKIGNKMFSNYYDDKNKNLLNKWKAKQQSGIQDVVGGVQDIQEQLKQAAMMMLQQGGTVDTSYTFPKTRPRPTDVPRNEWIPTPQSNSVSPNLIGNFEHYKIMSKVKFPREKQEGGTIEGQPDPNTEDLYSDQFQSPWGNQQEQAQQEQQPEQITSADPESNLSSRLEDWIFQDDDQKDNSVSDQYFQSDMFTNQDVNLPIQPVIDQLSNMGIKPSSINTGQHNKFSKHYSGSATDLGLNTSFGGDKNKMNKFYEFLNSPEGRKQFPGIKVRDERSKPNGQEVWTGPHIHLEIQ